MVHNVRPSDPDTSHAAADAILPRRAHDCRIALLAHAARPLGLTDYDLAHLVGRQQNSIGKRRGELRDNGYIEDSGMRRPAPSGSPAIVWRITQSGASLARVLRGR